MSAGWRIFSPLNHAAVAQLVEHDLAKVVVVGSNPISRSKKRNRAPQGARFSFLCGVRWRSPAPREGQ